MRGPSHLGTLQYLTACSSKLNMSVSFTECAARSVSKPPSYLVFSNPNLKASASALVFIASKSSSSGAMNRVDRSTPNDFSQGRSAVR